MTPLIDSKPQLERRPAEHFQRWSTAMVFGAAFAIYFMLINVGVLSASATVVLNDLAWTGFGLGAAIVCSLCANKLPQVERRAWRLVAAGCFSWFVGQVIWNYYELYLGKLPLFPHWMQIPFAGYPILLTVGIAALPKPSFAPIAKAPLTLRHLGNLGLIVCTFCGVLAITITEPAAHSNRGWPSLIFSLLHCTAYTVACMAALYLLWSYRWQTAHWPLVMVAVGSGLHATAFVADMHSRLAGTYHASDWVNAAWLIAIAGVACAAHEYAWSANRVAPKPPEALMQRERMLEAVMPALLVVIVTGTAVINAEWISARVIYLCAAIGVLFAIILGVREAWIQRQEQRLLAALSTNNDILLNTNRSLLDSEKRFRLLNQELEHHVAERTKNLQRAYEELESFSYAVAHDLKAPLRAVDGFGAMLHNDYGSKLDEQGRSYLARMRRGALTMALLVDDLLAYARIDRRESRVTAIHIDALINDCIEEQREEIDRTRFTLNVSVSHAKLTMDGEGLGIALRNVLQNAIKFGAAAATPTIEIEAKHDGNRVSVSVQDNGIGFDMQYHDRIFAMFQRLHRADDYPGTGIGLAIARKAVERAGGRIWAQSTLGAGATFYIELPAADASP